MELEFIKSFILNESKSGEDKLEMIKLKYSRDDFDPVISEDTMKYHFSKLYAAYVSKYNSGEGDPNFNEAGAYLHELYFQQFMIPDDKNKPFDESLELINGHFESFDKFKDEMEEVATKIQGSGWIYLSYNGKIKTIKNHAIRTDILLLIDWWEHAWALDYQSEKMDYLKNFYQIIDWKVINSRLISRKKNADNAKDE